MMDQRTFFLTIWEREGVATRKVLANIPEQASGYKPEPKARTAREIAWLIVREQILLVAGMERGEVQWEELPTPATMAEVLRTYDEAHQTLTKRLEALPAARWEENVPFTFDGQVAMQGPGFELAWGFLLDLVHHRGQLSTYLRPMGSTVPQIYGPSADEPM